MGKKSLPKHLRDNRANQLNSIHPAYHLSRGASPDEARAAAARLQAALAKITPMRFPEHAAERTPSSRDGRLRLRSGSPAERKPKS